MNWIKRLFSKKSETKQCDIHVVSCSLDYQVRQRQNDYHILIESHRRSAEIFCKDPIVEWDKNSKAERQQTRKRLDEHEEYLYDKIRNLDLILDVGENCN